MNGERAETYLRLLAETALRNGPAGADLSRVRHAVNVLTAVEAISEETAAAVLFDLESALAVRPGHASPGHARPGRGIPMPMRMLAAHRAPPPGPRPPQPQPPAGPRPPADRFAAVPVGQMILARGGDFPGTEIVLLALVITPGKGFISITSRRAGRFPGAEAAELPMSQLKAVDDTGTGYYLDFSGGLGGSWEDGRLDLHPAPTPGIRWIEVFTEADGPRVRIDCTAELPDVVVSAEKEPQSTLGERFLDSAAEGMLVALARLHGVKDMPAGLFGQGTEGAHLAASDLDGTIEALEAGGALPPDSPVRKRLAVLRQAAGAAGPRQPLTGLPEEWSSVLVYSFRRSWPRIHDGFATVVAVLPELDGVRFILCGMRSDAEGTVLQAQVLGLDLPGIDLGYRFTLWIRDNAGHWHLTGVRGWGRDGDDGVTCQLELLPPLHRAATALEVVLTGMSGRVRATMPLDWITVCE